MWLTRQRVCGGKGKGRTVATVMVVARAAEGVRAQRCSARAFGNVP